MRWVDRMIEQGDPAINEFSKIYNASERHTLRQHVLRINRDKSQQVSEAELEASKGKFVNYVQQIALLSDQGKCFSIKSDAQGVAFYLYIFSPFSCPFTQDKFL